MHKQRVTTLAAAMGLALTAAACGSSNDSSGAPSSGATATAANASAVKLGLITKFPADFYLAMQDAAKGWDAKTKDASVIIGTGKDAADDAGQINLIESMISQGVKGLAVTPSSPAVQPALQKAVDAGIKVVLLDNDLPDWKGKSSVISTNNKKGGVLAGQWLAKNLKPGSTIAVMQGVPGVPALDDRVSGMKEGLGSANIKIVGQAPTDCDQDKGVSAASDLLTAHNDVTAMYGACGPPTLGAIQSLQHAGKKPGNVTLMGFDGLPDEMKAIQAGTETATVVQFPAKMGTEGLATLLKV